MECGNKLLPRVKICFGLGKIPVPQKFRTPVEDRLFVGVHAGALLILGAGEKHLAVFLVRVGKQRVQLGGVADAEQRLQPGFGFGELPSLDQTEAQIVSIAIVCGVDLLGVPEPGDGGRDVALLDIELSEIVHHGEIPRIESG